MTTLPRVTWPSPPLATRRSRRTEMIVVAWNVGDSVLIGGLYQTARRRAAEIARRPIVISGGLAAHQDGVAIGPERLEQRRVELVEVGEDHALARELERLDELQELAGVVEVDARDLAHVD